MEIMTRIFKSATKFVLVLCAVCLNVLVFILGIKNGQDKDVVMAFIQLFTNFVIMIGSFYFGQKTAGEKTTEYNHSSSCPTCGHNINKNELQIASDKENIPTEQ